MKNVNFRLFTLTRSLWHAQLMLTIHNLQQIKILVDQMFVQIMVYLHLSLYLRKSGSLLIIVLNSLKV